MVGKSMFRKKSLYFQRNCSHLFKKVYVLFAFQFKKEKKKQGIGILSEEEPQYQIPEASGKTQVPEEFTENVSLAFATTPCIIDEQRRAGGCGT